jgi:hypothetical protein
MIKAVTDGLYLSAGEATYWLAGKSPTSMEAIKITGSAAYEGSGLTVEGEELIKKGIGKVVMWTSSEGVFVGAPGGSVFNKTWSHYAFDGGVPSCTAIYKSDHGYAQYLMAYSLEQFISGGVTIPMLRVNGLMS